MEEPITILDIRTTEALVFKSISQVLKKNFLNATFVFTPKGLFCQESSGDYLIVEILLGSDKFIKPWKIPVVEYGGFSLVQFNTDNFFEALKRVQKLDKLRLYIFENDSRTLHIEIYNDTRNTQILKSVPLIDIALSAGVPQSFQGIDPTATIIGGVFKKATADIYKQSKLSVRIVARLTGGQMQATNTDINPHAESFGTINMSEPIVYDELISTQRIHHFSAMAAGGVSKNIYIYAIKDHPFRLKADAGTLGIVSMYISPADDE